MKSKIWKSIELMLRCNKNSNINLVSYNQESNAGNSNSNINYRIWHGCAMQKQTWRLGNYEMCNCIFRT
jgi:hypothetical protein